MTKFRLCFLTAHDHLADTVDLSAETLDVAIKQSEDLGDGRKMELWRAAERVRVWPPASDA